MTKSTSTNLNLKPTAGYLIVEPQASQTQTASGIYLPESSSEKPQKGTVVAVGDDEIVSENFKRTSPVKVGDNVIYKKWGGTEIKHNGKEYLFVKFEDILGVETKQ